MEDREQIAAAITRRGVAYTYQSLEERYQASCGPDGKKDKRLALFKDRTKEGRAGIDVLEYKLEEFGNQVFLDESDEVVFGYLAYVMGALAGQPGKEVLVVSSKEAAANVGYHLMRYLGFRLKSQMADPPKKRIRTHYFPQWHAIVMECDKLAGINQTFLDRLGRHWVQTGNPSDAGLLKIKAKYPDRQWCKRYAIGLDPV